LVGRAVDTTTPFRLVHDIGIAMAWLGACLFITRYLMARRVLGPVAAAEAMSLTIYTAQVIVLSESSFSEGDHPIRLFVVMVCVALTFATLWRKGGRRGPLEAVVAWASARARQLAGSRPGTKSEAGKVD
jgi:uncharacterized membrane protein YeiB